jgi:hypothetical protein
VEVVGRVLSHLGGRFFSGGFSGVVFARLLVSSAVFFDAGGEGCDDVHVSSPVIELSWPALCKPMNELCLKVFQTASVIF